MDCIFCKIVKGDIPSTKVYEDDLVLAFDDIAPLAPVHVVVVPKKHIATLNDISDKDIWFAMLTAAQQVAKKKGVAESGYRIAVNCGQPRHPAGHAPPPPRAGRQAARRQDGLKRRGLDRSLLYVHHKPGLVHALGVRGQRGEVC